VWWLSDFSRVGDEKAAVEQLCAAEDWCTLTHWTVNEYRFAAEAVISAHGVEYPVRLVYPDQYPSVPAWVEPQDKTVRWSNHQYGDGGPLCLELRPDNWNPGATGAHLLRSAYNLLRTENPLGEGAKERVVSAHRISNIQSYDWDQEPVLIGAGCLERLKSGISRGVSALRWQAEDDVWPILVFDVVDRAQPQHPPSFDFGTFRFELPVVIGRGEPPSRRIDRVALATALGIQLDPEIYKGALVTLAVGSDDVVPFHSPDDSSAYRRKLIVLSDQSGMRSGRLASEKTVAIVGLGSVGSKVAEMLLRSGVHRFLLVDGDVMLPANLERHTLDWRDVGFRKANAVKRRLRQIVPGAAVDVVAANLNWQRSAHTHSDEIERITKCDLIVDATGDVPTALLLGAIAVENNKPFVSAQVFEGGLGCVLARSIPGRDPTYSQVRMAYLAYCEGQDVEPPQSGQRTYETLDEAGQPLVADDAAVSIAAANASRIVLDILDDSVGENATAWLLLGFRTGWLFSKHGSSIGLDVGPPLASPASDEDQEAREFAQALAREAVRDAIKASQ
jgi:molybdopterin/thiamine biosynthesis adenylyltransferase/ubiquitin-protein ligase